MSYSRYSVYNVTPSGNEYSLILDGENLTVSVLKNNTISQEEIESAIRSPIVKRFVKIFLLREDESVVKDITPWVQLTGSIEKNNNSGQTRSVSLSINNERVDGISMWTPQPNCGDLWFYNKIKIVSGLYVENKIYEVGEGIYVFKDPSLSDNGANYNISLQCYDKFALLDGTIDGIGDLDYEIPRKTPLYGAFSTMLKLERTTGIPFDLKDILFPSKYLNEVTPYTVKKTAENSIGVILKDLSLMISCDIKYDDNGNMNVIDSLADLDYHNRGVAWNFRNGEFKNPSITLSKSKIKNKVTVVGANINGRLVKGVAENNNLESIYNTKGGFGIKATKITDDLLYSSYLCKERARYELKKSAQEYASVSMQTIYIPHLEPGDLVRWTYDPWGINQEIFLVNKISVPLAAKDWMSITLTNLTELPL